MNIKTIKLIEESDWNDLVTKTYGKVYKLQQQDGCMDRQLLTIEIPFDNSCEEEEMNDNISDDHQDPNMGVKFQTWLDRDPKKPLEHQQYDWELNTHWQRRFYPNLQTIANDLHSKGLIEAGEYSINVDW